MLVPNEKYDYVNEKGIGFDHIDEFIFFFMVLRFFGQVAAMQVKHYSIHFLIRFKVRFISTFGQSSSSSRVLRQLVLTV